jgi:G2/mitotic-specific cyclin-B, other
MFTIFLDLALSCFFSIIVRKVFCFCIHSKAAKENLNHNEEKSCWYDYEDDFYKFHHLEECQVSTNSYGEKLICDDRKVLIDSMIDAHYALNLAPETLYLCVNIIDRYLSKFNPASTPTEKLQFVGLTSLLLASKYEERCKIHYLHIPMEDVRETEKLILQKLDWNLTVTTPYVFLVRNIKALSDEDKIMKNMVFFFSKLSLTHYSIVCDRKPSMIAASAVYCARIVAGRYPLWSNDLKICTRYS